MSFPPLCHDGTLRQCLCACVRCDAVPWTWTVQEVYSQAIGELAKKNMATVKNRGAYIMGVLKRMRQENCTH